MQLYELVADTPLAKQRVATGGPNIFLSDETAIGRTASGPGSLPIDWAQVSGNHCRVFLASKVQSTAPSAASLAFAVVYIQK